MSLRFRIPICALAAAMFISACSSSVMQNGQTGCTETLGGAVTASYQCDVASGSWDAGSNVTYVSLATVDSSSDPYAPAVHLPLVGEPQVGTYTITNHGTALGGVSIQQGIWFAGVAFPPSGQLSIIGSYTLTLTSVNLVTTTGTGRTYMVSGTLDANLVQECVEPAGVACPPATLHAVF